MKSFVFATLLVASSASSAAASQYEDFLLGILTTLAPSVHADVVPCLTATESGFDDIRLGIDLVKNGLIDGNMTAVYWGAVKLQTAFYELQVASDKCGLTELSADLQKLIDAISNNPLDLATKLLPYLPLVGLHLQLAVSNFNDGDFKASGEQVGSLAVLILGLVKGEKKVAKLDTDIQPYIQFLTGVLVAIAPAEGGDAAKCLNNTRDGMQELATAMQFLLMGIRTGDYGHLITAISHFQKALIDLDDAVEDCASEQLNRDIDNLILALTTRPTEVIISLLPHTPRIIQDVYAAFFAFEEERYQDAGEALGDILVLILKSA